ncbi:hypothetical protein AMS68_004764 [Peltaster fructicola]|uniref:NADP-dependent oxidoreductase domain-containing protein n=1 Tax=Peltaster fructicola TaxID=286661 RepID=A0A6H0XWV3_9PEZI|nr:hypothetical protein AMS68_004764 [Peltaster fructicola]
MFSPALPRGDLYDPMQFDSGNILGTSLLDDNTFLPDPSDLDVNLLQLRDLTHQPLQNIHMPDISQGILPHGQLGDIISNAETTIRPSTNGHFQNDVFDGDAMLERSSLPGARHRNFHQRASSGDNDPPSEINQARAEESVSRPSSHESSGDERCCATKIIKHFAGLLTAQSADTRDSIETLHNILQCSCTKDAYVISITALAIFKILDAQHEALRHMLHRASQAERLGFKPPVPSTSLSGDKDEYNNEKPRVTTDSSFKSKTSSTTESAPSRTFANSDTTATETTTAPAKKMPPPPPQPKSLLGRHRLLAPSASVRVSPLCLGGMSLGTYWKGMMGECTEEQAFELLDTFYDLGGNFIDTANMYQFGQSEQFIGNWLTKTGRRSEVVLATKYTISPVPIKPVQQSNWGGTGTKSMHLSLDFSLKNLQTDYVDIFYVHAWDYATSIPELMQSLNTLVQQGKVLYLGISDTPAWIVSKANEYARSHGLRPFSVYQGRYSAIIRDLERDILPMARDEGMAIIPWGVLGSGYLKSADTTEKGSRQTPHVLTGREEEVSKVLDGVAKKHSVPIQAVALAWAMQKAPYIFPLVGGSKVSHLKANAEALALQLGPEDVEVIDKAYPFDLGFPHNFINMAGYMSTGPQDISFLAQMGWYDYVTPSAAIKPHSAQK